MQYQNETVGVHTLDGRPKYNHKAIEERIKRIFIYKNVCQRIN